MNSKRKPLDTCRQLLTKLCVFPADENTGTLEKLSFSIFSLILFSAVLSVSVGSFVFYLKFASIDLELCLYALVQIAAFSPITYVTILTFFLRYKIVEIFDNLYKICEASKNQPEIIPQKMSFAPLYFIYDFSDASDHFDKLITETNDLCAWLWTIYLKYFSLGFTVGSVLICLVSYSISLIKSGHFDTKYMYYPFKIVWAKIISNIGYQL